ncbi:unnamed protein product [Kluyveromyces dobzhanskii CBS 2104]|uniref:WGS project CCBQ000000000 data, contig 00106 n=1 Tax=Kluyveromyces dobzhanskii CBS 2104 TaxID=1427455 RepID=A0A0A8L7Y5_9SACH|nr:unnamed protein product [Kluyveromyces dobzhanskii CBS 2104]
MDPQQPASGNSEWQFQVSPGAAWNLRAQARRGQAGSRDAVPLRVDELTDENQLNLEAVNGTTANIPGNNTLSDIFRSNQITNTRNIDRNETHDQVMNNMGTNSNGRETYDIGYVNTTEAENDMHNAPLGSTLSRDDVQVSSGLPADWFTTMIPGSLSPKQRSSLARERNSALSSLAQIEEDLRQLFESIEKGGWNLPPIEGNSEQLQHYFEKHKIDMRARQNIEYFVFKMQREISDSSTNWTEKEALLDFLLKQVQLTSDDTAALSEIVELSRYRFKFALGIIEIRKSYLKESLQLGIQRLRDLNYTEFVAESKLSSETVEQLKSTVMKQQRVILRAIEMELYSLHSYQEKYSEIIKRMAKSIHDYYRRKNQNPNVPNPIHYYRDLFSKYSPWTKRGLDLALYDMHVSEEEWNFMTNHVRSQLPQILSMVSKDNALYTRIKTPKNTFPLSDLPHEILAMVLEAKSQKANIVPLMAVSKSWAGVIAKLIYYRPHINKQQQLNSFLITMSKPKEETLFDYRSLIKRLNFSFVGDYMTDRKLEHFIGCPNLERLTLVFCKYITTKSVAKVLRGCQYLQSVDITGIHHIKDDLFQVLASDCERIQGLYVPHSNDVSPAAISHFITHAPMLKRVKITFNQSIENDLIMKMVRCCPFLVEVDLTSTPNINNHGLVILFTSLPQLREIRVTHNTNITDEFMLAVSQETMGLPALRLVDFSGCENITDKTIDKLVTLAPKLRNLFLGKCSRITDSALKSLARLGKNIQTMHFGHCFNISDEGVKVLVSNCPKIQYIDFACCTNLTNKTLYELAELPKLKRIGMVKCSQITDEGLLTMISIRGRNDTLERVHLSYCTSLTIYPIYELLMACPKLSHLSLTAVPSFLRPDITQFCRSPPSEFTANQRQIFCVFSGKGVHKLRHHLMGIHEPTDGPSTKSDEIFIRFLKNKNAIQSDSIEDEDLERLSHNADLDSAALFAASAVFNFANEPFNQIEFAHLDHVFSSMLLTSTDSEIVKSADLSEVEDFDQSFYNNPLDPRFIDRYVTVAPPASSNINNELADVIRKFRKILNRVLDFEVNVSSLCRIQFQYCGTLIAEMSSIYITFVDLNRYISEIYQRITSANDQKDLLGFVLWKKWWCPCFKDLMRNFKITALVLRIYVKESLTVLTRQRELVLQRARETWDREAANDLPDGEGDIDMGVNMLLPLGGNAAETADTDETNMNLRLFLPPGNEENREDTDDQIIDE